MALIAARLARIQASQTLAVAARSAQLRQAGRDIINFGLGELELSPPAFLREAAARAARDGRAASTPVAGTVSLRRAIASRLRQDHGLPYADDEVLVATGSKQVIFNAMCATLDPGDEVLVPAPYWVSYPDIVRMAGGTPVIVPTAPDTGFKLTAARLEEAISPRTKWLVLNSPNNPSAAVYAEDEVRALGEVLGRHRHVHLLSDEIYLPFHYAGARPVCMAAVLPQYRERILLVNGLSKSHAVIGWRLGFGAGTRELIEVMAKVQSQVTTSACSIAQDAAEAAYLGPQEAVAAIVAAMAARRHAALEEIARIPALRSAPADGAFYLFVDCARLIGRRTPQGTTLRSDVDVADYLLEHAAVATVPGTAFGTSPYLRLAYVCEEDRVRAGMRRIADAIACLQ